MLSRLAHVVLALSGVMLAGVAWGQQLTQLSGVIEDSTGGVVPGALVAVVNEETGFRRSAHSGNEGNYVIGALQPGIYKLTVRKEGFRTVVRFGVRLEVGLAARVDFTLPVGAMQETITVEGEAPLLNSDNASVGTLAPRDWIERLPLNGRGVLTLIELAPGSVVTPATRGESGQFTVNGQRPNSHYFTVDGISVNSGVSGGGQPAGATGGSLPGMTAFGSLHGLVPIEALDELRIQTSSYIPEFGRLPGAQVTLSSRSGTNELHGSLFEHFRHEKLEANDWFANRSGLGRAPLRHNDFGASIGGPIRKNKVFYFLTAEDVRISQPFAWRTPVPSDAARAAAPVWADPILGFFPRANGAALRAGVAEFTARDKRPAELRTISGRLDAAATSRLSVFARFQMSPSYTESGNVQVNHLDLRSWLGAGGFNLRIGPGFTNEFRVGTSEAFGRSYWRQSAGGLAQCTLSDLALSQFQSVIPCRGFYRFSIAGLGQVLNGSESDHRQRQWNISNTATWILGSHQLRVGGDYRRLTPERLQSQTYFSVLSDSLADLLAKRSLWVTVTPVGSNGARLHEVSLFFQDTWRMSQRVTVSYGMRWELNPAPISAAPLRDVTDPGGPLTPPTPQEAWKLRYTNLAPRLGVAWRLDKSGKTLLRAGGGLFYDSSMALANDLLNGASTQLLWQFASPAPDVSGSGRSLLTYRLDPNLRLPLVREWNATLERGLSQKDVVSVGYVGASGIKLLRREIGGREGPNLVQAATATNHGSSSYHALQAQYRRRFSEALQGNIAWSWSHSIDTASADSAFHWVGRGLPAWLDKGSSDFDVRHSFNMSGTYTWRKWSLDGIFRARTGFPITVLNAEYAMGVTFANVFRPDLVPGQAVWLNGRLNPAAFQSRGELLQGNLGRNAIAGFGMHQFDLAVRREFRLTEKLKLQSRMEMFNVLNHPNLADPVAYLASPLFGQPVSMLNLMLGTGTPATGLAPMFQAGGPRALQIVMRLKF